MERSCEAGYRLVSTLGALLASFAMVCRDILEGGPVYWIWLGDGSTVPDGASGNVVTRKLSSGKSVNACGKDATWDGRAAILLPWMSENL